MSSRQRSLEQERAKRAWDCVKEAKGRGQNTAKDYGTQARDLPARLQTNGLGQTLAFLKSKGYENGRPKSHGHVLLLEHVSAWVMEQVGAGDQDLLEWVINSASSEEYRRVMAEAMALAEWLKRFAESELPTGGGDEP